MKRILRSLRANPKRDVADELQFHIDMRAAEFRAAGMPEEEARHAAMAAFGDVTTMKERLTQVRQADADERRRADRMQELGSDLAFAFRTFRKNPGFTGAALATLSLGIGATIAVFTVVNGVLLRPLPYPNAARIAMIWMASDKPDGAGAQLPVSSGFYLNAVEATRTLQSMAAFRSWPFTLVSNGDAEQIQGARVTPSMFTILGAKPLHGRLLNEADAQVGAEKVAILSHALWQRRFGGLSSIVGQKIRLGEESFTVVGVMPDGFTFPRGAELPSGLQFALRTQLWTPLIFTDADRTAYGTLNIAAMGTLKDGATIDQARGDLTGSLRALLERLNARGVDLKFQTVSMQDQAAQPVRRGLWLLMGAVALVLFIACANVTNLLVARTAARRRELAMRAALGAGRSRIARQLITENIVLAMTGTAIGTVLSIWATRAMLAMVPGSMPRTDDVHVDWRVALGGMAIAIVAGSAFGIASTLQVRLRDLASTLRQAGSRTTSARGLGRRGLVAIEVALSVILVIGAALLITSFNRLQQVDSGLDTRNVLTASIGLPIAGGFDPRRDGPAWASFLSQMSERIERLQGVTAVGGTSAMPLSRNTEGGAYAIVGRPAPASGQAKSAGYGVVQGDYFKAAGIPVVSGRIFNPTDLATTTPVIIVNREFARVTFGDTSAVGRRMQTYFDFGGSTRTIVGVVGDTKQGGLDDPIRPMVYVPESQMTYPGLRFFVRTDGNPLALLPAIKREMKALNSRATIADVETLDDVASASMVRQRFSMTVLSIFAGLALALATVGLYGVIALSVAQRSREIGVRMALGAAPQDVLRQVLGEGLRLAMLGVLIGALGAFATSRLLAAMLFGVNAVNVGSYAIAITGVMGVATLATLIPARRATRVDPLLALRSD